MDRIGSYALALGPRALKALPAAAVVIISLAAGSPDHPTGADLSRGPAIDRILNRPEPTGEGPGSQLPEALPDPKLASSEVADPTSPPEPVSPALKIKPGTTPPPALGPSASINLPQALQLGRAGNLTISLARNRVDSAEVALKQAQLRWLPDLQLGTTYLLHDGLIQRAPGEIINTHRQSLFVGGGPNLRLEVNEGIFAPKIARSIIAATRAAEAATVNQTLLEVAERYIDLLAAYSAAEVAREAMTNAAELTRVTEQYQATGVGLPSDAARARAELELRRQQFELSAERIAVASVGLAQSLYLDPLILLVPAETNVFPIELIPANHPTEDLMAMALTSRPELAENQALVRASIDRFRQTKLRPYLPSIQLGFTSGGFGGGATGYPGGMDGKFGGRDDFLASALWEVRGFGLGEAAARRQGRIQVNAAEIQQGRTINRVMAEVASAQKSVQSRRRQIVVTEKAVADAMRSFQLNLRRIEGGAGLPIEVLQSIQALERARMEYMNVVSSFNKGEFRLLTSVGTTPSAPAGPTPTIEVTPRP